MMNIRTEEPEDYSRLLFEEEDKKRKQEAVNYVLTMVNKARVEAEIRRVKSFFAPDSPDNAAANKEKKAEKKKQQAENEEISFPLTPERKEALIRTMETAHSQLEEILSSIDPEHEPDPDDLGRYVKEFAEAINGQKAAEASLKIMRIVDKLEEDARNDIPNPYSLNQMRVAHQAACMGEMINRGIIAIEILSQTALTQERLINPEDNLDDFQAIVMMNIVNDLRKKIYREFDDPTIGLPENVPEKHLC